MAIERRCKCGYVCFRIDHGLEKDVVARPCPHRNGTMLQCCPSCDRVVGMWGAGMAGSMECRCWRKRIKTRDVKVN